MGVFARLLRRSEATEEAQAAETQTAEEPVAEVSAPAPVTEPATAATSKPAETAEGSTGTDGTDYTDRTGDTGDTEERACVEVPSSDARQVVSGDGAGIPQQQSAAEAADSEAGEDARR
ncbi:hypothetical protein ACYF6T_37515 [Streptomyces sp. 7R007]